MPKKKATATGERPLYIASERHKWMKYIEDGQEDDPVQVEVFVRKNLTEGELETLTFVPLLEGLEDADLRQAIRAREAEMWEAMAPFVTDWNVGHRTPSGELAPADPPSVAGGDQFLRYLPKKIVEQIFIDLRVRSTGLVKAKSSTPHVEPDSTTDESSSTPSDLDA